MFSAMGQQADVESLRITSVDFAHQEGFARSEADVTIGRVVGFALSAPMKRAFGDITSAPFVIQALFAEMHQRAEEDLFFRLHYDGDFDIKKQYAVAAGTPEAEERMLKELELRYKQNMSLDDAKKLADNIWRIGADVDGNGEPEPGLLANARPEAGFLDRNTSHQRKFGLI